MTGDFTSVPLRAGDRWTAARMQQGRVLLDTDWNLNLDGSARDTRHLAGDAIGPAGVPAGSSAFTISFSGGALTIGAGTMWVGGLLARNPTNLAYTAQAEITALPATGLALLYLDAFVEDVQAAEDPAGLLDPALGGVDTTTRSRIGWRVRTVPTDTGVCTAKDLPAGGSTGLLDVVRTSAPVAVDPCAPPDDPRGRLPDGLLRIEVIDGGTESTARFAWSYANGGDTVAATVTGTAVTLAPSPSVTFAPGDLVEVSTLARRADRRNHGTLFTVQTVTPQAGGDLVTLGAPSPVTGNPPGTCLRRWDGQSVGAATQVIATLADTDVGIAFTAHPGSYLVGDWWGVRVRGSAADAVETRTAGAPDGVLHAVTPLAVVDLSKAAVLNDCRPTFMPLTELRGGTCTVTAFPGDNLQAGLDALPSSGGELCLAAGHYPLSAPLQLSGKQRVMITGVGPSTVLHIHDAEAALVATLCDDIEIRDLRVEAGQPHPPSTPPGDRHLLGALTMLGCREIRVHDCEISCPDSAGRAQSCLYVAPDKDGVMPDQVTIRNNRLEVGNQQVGILVVSSGEVTIADNAVRLAPLSTRTAPKPILLVARELGRYIAAHILAESVPGGQRINLPSDVVIRVGGARQVKQLAADWAEKTTPSALKKARSPRAALERYTTTAALQPHAAGLDKASERFLVDAVRSARSISQGIVVAGERAPRVRIQHNHVISAIQGIHVGVGGGAGHEQSAGQVVISGNTVENLVPFYWTRQRNAIYVGSAASTTLLDNHAHLSRGTLASLNELSPTGVEAVRIWGRLGPWLQIRGIDLTGGYVVGVTIVKTSPALATRRPPPVVHYVSDVLNLNGDGVRLEISSDVVTERIIPSVVHKEKSAP